MKIENFYGFLDNGWKKKPEIIEWLSKKGEKVNERDFRRFVEKFNRDFGNNQHFFIAHSSKGYLLTNDPDKIADSIKDDFRRAMKLLKRNYKTRKELQLINQLSLTEQEASIYEIVKGFEQ